jgi:tRNA G10  N-methylase Trm11
MKYLFILGRNIELSKKEVECYLERTGNEIINSILKENGFLVEIDKELSNNAIDFLGGVLRIGKVLDKVENLDKLMIYSGTKNNISYVLWEFSSQIEEVKDYLKHRFREEKLKASLKTLNKKIKMQGNSEEIFIPSSKLIDEEYFVFENFFGCVIQKTNYEEIEKRDMERPLRRPSLDISPRLAKIMVNLSLIKFSSGEKLLDPFCGVGVILSEGLLQSLEVIGIDKDSKAIKGAKENLEWSGFSKKNYGLVVGDSKEVKIPEVNCIVTEPDLGERLKKIPTKERAEKQLRNFEKLIVQVLNNLKKRVSGRVVFSSPYIRIGKKRLSCDVDNICSRTGYKKAFEGIPEFREGQVVGRMIWVLEKE